MPRLSKAEFIKLQKKLKTDAEIARKFSITRQAIFLLRTEYGIKSSVADNPKRNAKIVSLYKKGTTGTELAKRYDLSASQAYRILHETGALKKKRK
jgi:Mor family transcriptional regulator